MRRQAVIKFMPVLLATTIVALACENPPSVAPARPLFATGDGPTDRITGGGKLDDGRDFATFGFNARDGQGELQWVQHCLDGVSGSTTCALGAFTFHGSTVIGYGSDPADPDHCRVWSGTGDANFKDLNTTSTGTFSAKACDFGEPGRGNDTMCFFATTTAGVYIRGDGVASSEILNVGNIQLHNGGTDPSTVTCLSVQPE
jgi:hypothetical protein